MSEIFLRDPASWLLLIVFQCSCSTKTKALNIALHSMLIKYHLASLFKFALSKLLPL